MTDLILGFFLRVSFQVYLEEELIFRVWGLDGVWYCRCDNLGQVVCVPVYMYFLFCQISLQTESSMVVAVIFLKSSGSVWKSWASWGAFCVVSAEFWKQIVFYYSDICGSLIAHYMPCLMYVLHVLHARSKSQQHTVLGSHCVFQSQEVGKKLQAFQRSSRRTYATEFL